MQPVVSYFCLSITRQTTYVVGEGLQSIGPAAALSAVSLNSAGAVQVGGGTSIYRNVGAFPVDPCPKYLGATPVFDDAYLVSYKTFATGTGMINVMKVDSSRKATVMSSKSNSQDLYKVVTLNQATGLFVSISQAQSKTTNTAVIAGKVDKVNGYDITYGSETTYSFAASYSFDPTITALSETTFAIAFYGGSPLQCYTRWGKSIHYLYYIASYSECKPAYVTSFNRHI